MVVWAAMVDMEALAMVDWAMAHTVDMATHIPTPRTVRIERKDLRHLNDLTIVKNAFFYGI